MNIDEAKRLVLFLCLAWFVGLEPGGTPSGERRFTASNASS